MVRVKRSSGVPTMPSRHEDSRHEEGEGGNGENGILNPATLSAPPLWIPTDHLFLCESQRSQRAAAHLREVNIAIHPFIPGLLIRSRTHRFCFTDLIAPPYRSPSTGVQSKYR